MRSIVLIFLTSWLLLFAAVAEAIDLELCGEDGVTEVPDFAAGRDANGCLMIETGNGDPAVPFQWSEFHTSGVSGSSIDSGENPQVPIIPIYRAACANTGIGCTALYWDVTIDHYLDSSAKNDDLLFVGNGYGYEYLLIKDSLIANTWTCKGGTGRQGPNGLACAPGEFSSSHVDGLQLRGHPINGGWFMMQDSVFVNGFNLHMLVQTGAEHGSLGGFVLQGVHFGRVQSVGAATSWIDDCLANHDSSSGGEDICPQGRAQIGNDMREVWLIDVFGTTMIDAKGNHEKIVVVNTGCDSQGCGKSAPGFNNGWPHPLPAISVDGPSVCPDGQIQDYNGSPTFCYRSLEAARVDHKLPPFVQLSDAGWSSTPSSEPEPTPEPEPEPTPEPEPEDPPAQEPEPEPAPDPKPTASPTCEIVISRPVPCDEVQ